MEILKTIESKLLKNQFKIFSKDLKRPWGGFLIIDEQQSKKFFNFFFKKNSTNNIDFSNKLSPKILIIKPNKRLSWQYHNRRSEIWSVIKGDILVSKSLDDEEVKPFKLVEKDQINIGKEIRHRIIGTDDYALVAEIWIHTHKNNPSDENDIIRLQDDFNRN
tara:strand:- start:18 stop:503 length:486 start_codon:yes stop_codon:yes gene_type:complete